jgi:hypothetical protein
MEMSVERSVRVQNRGGVLIIHVELWVNAILAVWLAKITLLIIKVLATAAVQGNTYKQIWVSLDSV